MTERLRIAAAFILLPGIVAIVVLAALFSSDLYATPSASWTPASLSQTIDPGRSKDVVVSFTALARLPSASIRVVPELQPFVRVSPESLGSVQKGQAVSLTITFSAPLAALPRIIDGTIQLRISDGRNAAISQPLPVTINVVWSRFVDAQSGLTFAYPTLGAPGSVEVSQKSDNKGRSYTEYEMYFAAPGSTDVGPQYSLLRSPNTQWSSLTDWFIANVDPQSEFVGANVYTQTTLDNGMTVFVRTGPMPTSYTDGQHDPVADIYAMPATGNYVLAVGASNGGSLGLSVDALFQQFLAMLGSIEGSSVSSTSPFR